MKLSRVVIVAVLALAAPLFAQAPGQEPGLPVPPGAPGKFIVHTQGGMEAGVSGAAGGIMIRREMGEWWKNSDVAKKLQLSDAQVTKLNQIFYDHRLKLIDYKAAMEKEDLRLQNLLDQDKPEEKEVSTQVDQVLAARGKLEREFTMMNLDLREVLTVAQWRQLKAIQEQRGPEDRVFFYRKMGPNTMFKDGSGPGPEVMPMPPLPDPPEPPGDGMF